MSFYIESPFDPIVDVHWKKKKPDEPPPDEGGPYCGYYGWGTTLVDAATGRRAGYGPHQYPPMIGTFPLTGNVAPDGTRLGELIGVIPPIDVLTADPEGMSIHPLTLGNGEITFSNDQLVRLNDPQGRENPCAWSVPMVGGTSDEGPLVIKGYQINMSWQSTTDADISYGIGLCHPYRGTFNKPPAPFMVIGAASGSNSYFYDFKYKDWSTNNSIVNEGNQFDPSLGGPAALWTMWYIDFLGIWAVNSSFLFTGLNAPGDFNMFEIRAQCQPLFNLTS